MSLGYHFVLWDVSDTHPGADGKVGKHQRPSGQRLRLRFNTDKVGETKTNVNISNLGEELKRDNEHEYYESFYRNITENTNLSHFKDRSPVLLEYYYRSLIHT